MMSREAEAQDAREERAFAARELQAEQAMEAEARREQMVDARTTRRLRTHAGGLMSGSPFFDEGANDDEAGTSVPPPP